jgi:hypothetical protein
MLGCRTKVRFVRREELKYCAKHRRIGKARAQGIGIQAGQRQQPFGPRPIGQHPDQGAKRQGKGVGGGLGFAKNCRAPA